MPEDRPVIVFSVHQWIGFRRLCRTAIELVGRDTKPRSIILWANGHFELADYSKATHHLAMCVAHFSWDAIFGVKRTYAPIIQNTDGI